MNSESQMQERLRITEIFYSIQGESTSVGVPTAFVRLTGCPLRCSYCDTEYAFQGGQWMSFAEIIKQVESFETSYVTVTGGEPLAQKSCITLLDQLCSAGFTVSLETSGALSLAAVGKDVIKVMDIKTPGSAEESRNLWSNIELLDSKDQIKFVICSEQDYQWDSCPANYEIECILIFFFEFVAFYPAVLSDYITKFKVINEFLNCLNLFRS